MLIPMYVHDTVHVGGGVQETAGFGPLFLLYGFQDHAQAMRLDSKHLHLPNHFTDPKISFLIRGMLNKNLA